MPKKLTFTFGDFKTVINISKKTPDINKITGNLNNLLVISDENTAFIAEKICGNHSLPYCILKSGEENKNWQSVESILSAAIKANLGRDGIFLAVGGGVICDTAGFAASVYMRGCRLILVPTTLLAMADSSVGGKTGFDIFGIKNLTGSFYPAENIYMPLNVLSSLPYKEWKSGMAELIKTAVLSGDDFFEQLAEINFFENIEQIDLKKLSECIKKAVIFKASIVSEDLRDTGKRLLLNLGHTFAHALESVIGLGKVSHGEAVAWGIIRACDLGCALGITPEKRAKKIRDIINGFGYNSSFSYDTNAVLNAIKNDKKKKNCKLTFIVPDKKSARPVILETENELKLLKNILTENAA